MPDCLFWTLDNRDNQHRCIPKTSDAGYHSYEGHISGVRGCLDSWMIRLSNKSYKTEEMEDDIVCEGSVISAFYNRTAKGSPPIGFQLLATHIPPFAAKNIKLQNLGSKEFPRSWFILQFLHVMLSFIGTVFGSFLSRLCPGLYGCLMGGRVRGERAGELKTSFTALADCSQV